MLYRRLVIPGASYFFTLITHQRACLFSDQCNIERWLRAVTKVQNARPFIVEAEVILPDHLHVIWTLPEADADYATRIRLIKTAFTKDLALPLSGNATSESRSRKCESGVWQRRYWEHLIRDECDFQAYLDYIHLNPVKHGFVARPGDWPHSTFGIWLGRGVYDPEWSSSDLTLLPHRTGRE